MADPGMRELHFVLRGASTPDRVATAAQMFADSLRHIAPDLAAGDVTMVVDNFDMRSAVRGRTGPGKAAVELLERLVSNPTRAVQEHPEIATAARSLASYARKVIDAKPLFLNDEKKEVARVDKLFVKMMNAAGSDTSKGEGARGETVVYSRVYRLGRTSESGRLMARIRLDGRQVDVAIHHSSQTHVLWDIAKRETLASIRLRGRWQDDPAKGAADMRNVEIMSVDALFRPWSGKELLQDARRHAKAFEGTDFAAIASELLE